MHKTRHELHDTAKFAAEVHRSLFPFPPIRIFLPLHIFIILVVSVSVSLSRCIPRVTAGDAGSLQVSETTAAEWRRACAVSNNTVAFMILAGSLTLQVARTIIVMVGAAAWSLLVCQSIVTAERAKCIDCDASTPRASQLRA